MIWVANKADLSFYSDIDPDLCYCENLATASDMYLQGSWNPSAGPYTYVAQVWSVDGNTIYENIDTALYSIYFGVNPFTGQHYFSFQLLSYSPAMCENKCFLVRIGVGNAAGQTVFAAWTERYCIASCCEFASGITITAPGVIQYTSTVPVNGQSVQPTAACGRKLIRLITTSDCYNAFDNTYYGKPKTVIQGSYFRFVKISTFQGTVKQKPRDISRQYSYNCKVERIESARQYLLEAYEYFPIWKVDEIENQLSSSGIWVDDYIHFNKYEYSGGTPFKKINDNICDEVFKLEAILNDCIIRQIFGCSVSCVESEDSGNFFVVPNDYQGGLFYNANGVPIAETVINSAPEYGPSLVNWFLSQGLEAEIVAFSVVPCDFTAVIKVNGAVIPPAIYYDAPIFSKKIVPVFLDGPDNICDYIANNNCVPPVVDDITYGDMPCDVPIVDDITYGDLSGDPVVITQQGTWVLDSSPDTEGTVYNNIVTLDIAGTKPISATAGAVYAVSNELIANLSPNGVPNVPRTISYSDTASLMIGTDGTVKINGTFDIAVDNELTVDFNNIIYNII